MRGGAGGVENTSARGKSGDGARKRVHAQRDTIDKGPDGKVDGHDGTSNEKVFRFRVCGTDGHSSRFRVGTKRRRRTGWQLDVRGEMGERDGREGGRGKKKERMREKGSTKTLGVTSRNLRRAKEQ